MADLLEVFHQLRKCDMRLNPEKCVFGVSGGKFLDFMLSARGIEANPEKCQAVISMRSPQNLKEVQKLAGRLIALSRFLPCLAEIAKPIVGLLKKVKKFEWSVGCEEAFQALKQRLGSPPILSKPEPQADMVVYLCVSNEAINAVLVQEKEVQRPMYFISRMLQEAETRYQLLEKVALGLVHTARRLRQYFQSHHVISKGHFVNDLLTIHVDGSSNNQGIGAGIILEGPNGLSFEQSLRFAFKASNNQAEYEALLAGLRLAQERMRNTFDEVQVKHTPREHNERADQLAQLASSNRKPRQLQTTLHLDLSAPSVNSVENMSISDSAQTWMSEIKDYTVRKLQTQAARYSVVGGELYRRGFSTPLLKCIDSAQAEYVLREIHDGICGSHLGGRTMAAKVLRAGYYWLTLRTDCAEFVKRCI
ncbi:uncharacterized protein LOC109791001 [Cajanus cajan]|uniref:uncharacterized protein LOC109791001 n=1 Tax=Cajanus cajan TaxID=3821 RepID=UPI00098D88FF|nr:uncharacterized protein LOC109791001 [Cajanus cajan]